MFIVDAEGVQKSFGVQKALRAVSLFVREGECFGLLGPNGAGKSTFQKMLYGFVRRDAGKLLVLGWDPNDKAPHIKAHLGVVPQENALDEELTVRQNLEIYAGYFGLKGKTARLRIDRLLEEWALAHRSGERIRRLSGGMARRLVLARALIHEPRVVLLDEPTTGLDPQVRHLFWAKLRALKQHGVTLILCTHYMEEAQQLCDRLVILNEGEVLAQGSPKELIRRFSAPFVLETTAEEARRGEGFSGEVHREAYGDKIYFYADSPAPLEKVAEDLSGDFSIRPAHLEDVFLKLTGRELNHDD